MFNEIYKLIIYRSFHDDEIFRSLSSIIINIEQDTYTKDECINTIYEQLNKLLAVATAYGFNRNLWQNFLTYLLITSENSYSLVSEKVGYQEGSVNHFAINDFKIIKQLFHYDFSQIEAKLGIDCFQIITNYQAMKKKDHMYNQNVSRMVNELSLQIHEAKDEMAVFYLVSDFYKQYGVGMFGLNKAFRIKSYTNDEIAFLPINNMEQVYLKDLVGYELQKQKLIDNTKAFVEGRSANNVLLYGDSGTGKSTSIKAIVNEFYPQGLRMIEIYKHQFKDLSSIISRIKNRNYRFIIYMDDLSFEEFEIEYKFLKALIEGGVETKPDNVLIYATSNRRHLIRETWGARSAMSNDELPPSDTIQEKLSLVARFGLSICYERPRQKEYYNIVLELAKRHKNLNLSEEELISAARKWELSHGGMSGRAAQQLIYDLLSKQSDETL